MLCGLQIGMLILGIVALATGKITFDKRWGLRGGPAYFAGLLMLLPLPVALLNGFIVGVNAVQQGRDFEDDQLFILAVEAASTLGILAIVGLIWAAAAGALPGAREPRRRDEDSDDYYDRGRYNRDRYDDDDDDRDEEDRWEERRRRRREQERERERYRDEEEEDDRDRPQDFRIRE